MGLSCAIVGLPNVGKSTLFNALTSTAQAQAANYPFCTIEPNMGRVCVPDLRLYQLAELFKSQKIIPTQLEFIDVAGLIRGASQGEGLGNQFLGHIRQTDAIIHLIRCFENEDITHVEGTIDPVRDIEVIETELLLADLESVQKKLKNLEKKAKGGESEARLEFELAQKMLPHLEAGIPVSALALTDEEMITLNGLHLLTHKPILYVCNVNESEAATGNHYTKRVYDYVKSHHTNPAHPDFIPVVVISAQIEAEVSTLEESEKSEFLAALGLLETGLNQIVRFGYDLLNLHTFFTMGPKEARAWTILKGTKAPQAAGTIHSDFEKGFICAEIMSCNDLITFGSENEVKNQGKLSLEGKEYVMKDGDVCHFRFNV